VSGTNPNLIVFAIFALTFSVCATGGIIAWSLHRLNYSLIALVSLSARKGRELPINVDKLVPRRLQTPAETTHIHIPRSMMPNEDPEDIERRRKQIIPD